MPKKPIDYPIELSPYEILGLSENNSIEEIHAVYRRLVLVLHPDKELTTEAKRLGWSREDKNEAFIKVRNAYKQILSERRESNAPDYNIEYYIEEELKQDNLLRQYNEFSDVRTPIVDTRREPTIEIRPGEKFNSDKFNKFFEHSKKKQEQAGFSDPFSRGYSDIFGTTRSTSEEISKAMMSRQDISVETPKEFSVPQMENGRLVEWNPVENQLLSEPSVGYSELGVSNINDFSFSIKSKSSEGIQGTDLMSVYGKNNEYWEDSVKRDQQMYQRYSDTLSVDKKMNMHKSERSGFNFSEIDPRIEQQIRRDAEQRQKMEELRNFQLKREDKYYKNNSTFRINF